MPKVSVIVPVHNTERFLGRCIESLVSQTIDDIEIILVDDASTDRSLEIMNSYQEKYPTKIKIVTSPINVGAGTARNIGLDIASGSYIGFVDSDDYVTPEMYEKLLEAIETTGADVSRTTQQKFLCGIDMSKIRRNQNELHEPLIYPETHESFFITEPPGVTNKLFKREIIGDRRFPDGLKWEDYPFTIPLLVRTSSIASTADKHYIYNLHLNNTTLTDARRLNRQVLDIFTGSDMIGAECFTQDISPNVRKQLEFVQIQHCLIRLKEVAGTNIPLNEKRELLTLLSELIKTKYGSWQDHEIYQQQKKSSLIHGMRMAVVERLLLPPENIPQDEATLKQLIKTKLDNNAK